ncbi:MAG TPA: PilW family protein [Dyella sp.]|uniref:PilW family protein n=1 Tax=Dyella sp. TaxID=1869338 RepID=UPI002BD9BF5B|nr:PilW family protein [Dyella sp.]HTV84376.1 PilW family protein [Dyella sp.]
MSAPPSSRRQRGMSLIELMIAMLLGLLVSAGVVVLFDSASRFFSAQAQLSRLQEEGRFAIAQIRSDLAMAGGQYCNNSGGDARGVADSGVDGLRAPTVYASDMNALTKALADVTTPLGAVPSAPYTFPSSLAMRGYDCTTNACTPLDPSKGTSIPAMGTAVGKRVVGASVITVRYVNPSGGWTVSADSGASGSKVIKQGDGSLGIRLVPAAGEPAIKDFQGSLALLADCSNGQVFAVSGQGSSTLASTGNNTVQPVLDERMAAPRLFDLSRNLQTVTYYLKVVDSGDGSGHTTGGLVRRVNGGNGAVNGGSAEEIARGVERLDFRYGVRLRDGSVRYYTAAQVDNAPTSDCLAVPVPMPGGGDHGCLWRSVSLIEVNLLMDGQHPLYSLTPDELAYTYAADNASKGPQSPQSPIAADRNVTPPQQGFPLPMLRREFSTVVAVRNVNP